jgi:hypothetical protein
MRKGVGQKAGYHGRRNFKDTNPLISSLLVFFVRDGNFVGSESGRKQSVNSYRIWSTVHFTNCLYSTVHWEGGVGRRRSERRYSRGVTVHNTSKV